MVQLESMSFFSFLRCFRSLSLGAWGFVVKQFLYVFVFPFFSTDSQVKLFMANSVDTADDRLFLSGFYYPQFYRDYLRSRSKG